VVIAEDEPIVENVKRLDKIKSPLDYQNILNALQLHYFFEQISQQHKYVFSSVMREDIVMKMFYCFVRAGEFVFRQNDQASCYFIVDEGECEVIIHDEVKKTITKGSAFGELALLYSAPRSASIRATKDSYFWAIDRVRFRKAVEELALKDY
jgi:cGMP-dependent protein kinase 1